MPITRTWTFTFTLAALLSWPVVAGAGDRIAFTATVDGQAEVCSVDADGGGWTRLTDAPGDDAQPTWSGDGTRIAFISDREGRRDIWRMSADGSKQVRLTDVVEAGVPIEFTHPAWSPSGHRVAFQSEPNANHPKPSLWIVGPDGTQLQSLAFLSAGTILVHPAWSTYRGLIAAWVVPEAEMSAGFRGGLMSYGFSDVVSHGSMHQAVRNPDVSRDGDWLAFDADGRIWRDRSSIEGPVDITGAGAAAQTNPSWSPDATRIAYESEGWIWTMAADGSDRRRLVEGADPAWSPALPATAVAPATWGGVKLRLYGN